MNNKVKVFTYVLLVAFLQGCLLDRDDLNITVTGLSGELEVSVSGEEGSFQIDEYKPQISLNYVNREPKVVSITKAPATQRCEFENGSETVNVASKQVFISIYCFNTTYFPAGTRQWGASKIYRTDGSSEGTLLLEVDYIESIANSMFYNMPAVTNKNHEVISDEFFIRENKYVLKGGHNIWIASDGTSGSEEILEYFHGASEILRTETALFSLKTNASGSQEVWRHNGLFTPPVKLIDLEGKGFSSLRQFGSKLTIMSAGYISEITSAGLLTYPLAGAVLYQGSDTDQVLYLSEATRYYNHERIDYSLFLSKARLGNISRLQVPVENIRSEHVLGVFNSEIILGFGFYDSDDEYCKAVYRVSNNALNEVVTVCEFVDFELTQNGLYFLVADENYDNHYKVMVIQQLARPRAKEITSLSLPEGEQVTRLYIEDDLYFLFTYTHDAHQPLAPYYISSEVSGYSYSLTQGEWRNFVNADSAYCGFFCSGWNSARLLGKTNGKYIVSFATPEYGYEPWVTDGTYEGTELLLDTEPGVDNGLIPNFEYNF